jgi:hypothetical protein
MSAIDQCIAEQIRCAEWLIRNRRLAGTSEYRGARLGLADYVGKEASVAAGGW